VSIFDLIEVHLHEELDAFASTCGDETVQKAIDAQRKALRKKYTGKTALTSWSASDRSATARDRFLSRNRICAQWNDRTDAGFGFLPDELYESLGEARSFLTRVLEPLDSEWSNPALVASQFAVGSGSALGSEYNDLYAKAFDGPLLFPSETSLYLWYTMIDRNGLRPIEDERQRWHRPPIIHNAAKWSSVPKNNETDRSIVIPTNGGGLIARSIGIALEQVLTSLGLCIEDQSDRNRELARLGSLPPLDELEEAVHPCTIDLSDASDSLYYNLIRWLFRFLPNIWQAMIAARDKVVMVEGNAHHMGIFSTMGCGFTFPLQTLVFYALARSVTVTSATKLRFDKTDLHLALRHVAAFGDDIIVPKIAYEDLISLMLSIGLAPNTEKSFGDGPFRESCGSDWFRGANVRGIYCQKLDDSGDLLSLFNRLLWWSSQWEIPIPITLGFIWRKLPARCRNAVPLWESTKAGIRWHEKGSYQPSRLIVGPLKGCDWYRPWRPNKASRSIATSDVNLDGEQIEHAVQYDSIDDRPKRRVVSHFYVRNAKAYIQIALAGGVSGSTVGQRSTVQSYSQNRWEAVFNWVSDPMPLTTLIGGNAIREPARKYCQPGFPVGWTGRVVRFRRMTRTLAFVPG